MSSVPKGRASIRLGLSKSRGKKNLKSLKVPEHKELEKMAKEFAENLKNNSDFRTFLKEGRGLSDTVIEKYQLGYARVHPKYENSGERLTMSIYKDGKCVNIRFHSFRNKKAKDLPYTEGLPYATWLYPEDQLKNHELYLCEGELDALCAISHGLSAITVTGGAGTWKKEFNPLFKGKDVNIIYDCDLAGRKGASKVTQQLQGIARVKNIDLGLNEGEDLTNWFVDYEKSKEELQEKIASSTTVAFPKDHLVSPDEPKLLKDVILEIEDFKALELPEKKILLHPWLTEQSIVLITGWRGVGKSWLAMSILDAIVRKKPFGPWQTKTSVPSLFLDAEMPIRDTIERFSLLNPNGERESPMYIYSEAYANMLGYPRISLIDRQWQLRMTEVLVSKGIKLWVVDNVASLATGIDENSKQDWDPINQWLLELRFAGISTILLHHLGKGGDQRGTSAREDNIDMSIILKRPPGYAPEQGAKFNVSFSKARVPVESLELMADTQFQLTVDEDGRLTWTWGNPEKKAKTEILKRVHEGMINKEIAETLDIDKSYVSRVKKKAIQDSILTAKGKLTKTGLSAISEE